MATKARDIMTGGAECVGENETLVDAARNTYAQTAVAPYAVRAKPGAPVATPLFWDEVANAEPRRWTLGDVPSRLSERGDPWEGIASAAGSLP